MDVHLLAHEHDLRRRSTERSWSLIVTGHKPVLVDKHDHCALYIVVFKRSLRTRSITSCSHCCCEDALSKSVLRRLRLQVLAVEHVCLGTGRSSPSLDISD